MAVAVCFGLAAVRGGLCCFIPSGRWLLDDCPTEGRALPRPTGASSEGEAGAVVRVDGRGIGSQSHDDTTGVFFTLFFFLYGCLSDMGE